MRERVHLAGYDPYPFERSGTPDVWGRGLRHATIHGVDEEKFDELRGAELAGNLGHAMSLGGLTGAFVFRKNKTLMTVSLGVAVLGVIVGAAQGK